MTLDDIKRDIRHDDECASIEGANGWEGTAPECNCTRRDKIAYLERLQEPTDEMQMAYYDTGNDRFFLTWNAVLAAAEEAQ